MIASTHRPWQHCARHLRPSTMGMAVLAVVGVAGPAQALAQTQSTSELASVEVVGRRQGGTYEATEVSGAKSSLPLMELPQSVRVMSRQAIDDLGATRLDDVLDYVGGVSRQNSFGGLWDNIAIRGLPGNENTGMAMLLNGFAGNRGFNAPRDLAAIERIEFLKGPAAALYGASEPGGTVNLVSKRPQWKAGHALEFYAGSFDTYRTALDSTGPLGESVAYRFNAAVERRDSFRDHIQGRRDVVAPALTWRLGGSTEISYFGEYIDHRAPLDRGVVAVNNQLGAVPRERFLGEPADGDITVRNGTHQIVLEHELSPDWRARAGLGYRETSLVGFSTEATRLNPVDVGPTLWRQRRYRDYHSHDGSLQLELQGRVRLAGMVHEPLVSLETYRFTLGQRLLRINPSAAAPYPIDIYAPVYGGVQPTPTPNTDTVEQQRNTAITLQDAVTLAPQWRLVAGLRLDHYRQTLDNRRNPAASTSQSPDATSPRLGLTWLPSPQWAVYVNGGKSFRPNIGVDAAGQAFDPESGRAFEVGAKWERQDKRLGANLALFDIRKRNVITTAPSGTAPIAAGEITSRGAEGDISGQLTQNWRLTASFTLNDVKISRDEVLLETGRRLLNVPRVNASALAVYEDALPSGGRFGIGGGVTHVGARLGQAYTKADAATGTAEFELPAYTTAKLVAYWRVNATLRLSLDIDNLFDSTYYTNSYSRMWISPGSPRNFTLGAQLKF